jgi:hypothetical protein
VWGHIHLSEVNILPFSELFLINFIGMTFIYRY